MKTGLLLSAALVLSFGAADALAQTNVPLIPRETIFGNPSRAAGRISPDGKWLSWVAPRDGVMNVWVAPASDPEAARPLTSEKTRPIPEYFWAPDASGILYIEDAGGEENFHLFGVDLNGGQTRDLTPFD